MKNLQLTFLFLVAISFSLSAQGKYDKEVTKGAKMLTSALQIEDYATAVEYFHPNVIAMAGGKASLRSILKETAEMKKKDGFDIIQTTTLGSGDYIDAGNEIHTIVGQEQVFKLGNMKFKTDVYLLAISDDNGTNWKYVNLEAYNQDNIKIFFPNFNDNLKLPAPPIAVQLK